MTHFLTSIGLLAMLAACSAAPGDASAPPQDRLLVVDTHIDLPYRLHLDPTDVSQRTVRGDFDYPRAAAGGLDGAFMSIYVPASVDTAGDGMSLAEQLIERVETIGREHPDKFVVATCPSDVEKAQRQGLIALPMGLENGGPIGGDLKRLEALFDLGIRYVTLAHSRANALADSSYDDNKRWGGLSEDGRAVVRHMNRLGMMVDVSHLSDDAFWHVLSETEGPVIASHSALRHFTPGWERNLSDTMVEALGQQGGVIQISFGSGFLTQAAREYSSRAATAARQFMDAQHLNGQAPEVRAFVTDYRQRHPYPYATIDDALDHIDRAVLLAGVDGVGIGSDFDGVGDSLPQGLKDASAYPNLISGLRGRGYSRAAIAKIMGQNLMRVWRSAYRQGIEHGTRPQCRL